MLYINHVDKWERRHTYWLTNRKKNGHPLQFQCIPAHCCAAHGRWTKFVQVHIARETAGNMCVRCSTWHKGVVFRLRISLHCAPLWKRNVQPLIPFWRRVCLCPYTSSLSNRAGQCWFYFSCLCPDSLRRYYLVHCTVHHCIWASKFWVWRWTRDKAP